MKIENFKLKILQGFTLLEMLVVIGIIGILVGLGAVSYSTAQKKARDARRRGDLSASQKALEQCYSVNTYQYPTVTNSSGAITISPLPASCTNFSIIDPLNNSAYKYTVTATSTSAYTIQAVLEGDGSTITVSNQQ